MAFFSDLQASTPKGFHNQDMIQLDLLTCLFWNYANLSVWIMSKMTFDPFLSNTLDLKFTVSLNS